MTIFSLGNIHLLVFTDLDGTILDHNTYSFESALPAIEILKDKKIPLIFCTSKTRAEVEEYRHQLGNFHPFISENGGAIFIPRHYFSYDFYFTRQDPDCFIIELGTPYIKLREVFSQMREQFPAKLKGFGDVSPQEVADLCGLSLPLAKLAKKREYDEPFILEDASAEKEIQEIASRSNLKITRGGLFYHLMGDNDKGKAVLFLIEIYKKKHGNLKTIALGDSSNDLPMLEAVDYPILVQKPDGNYDPQVKLSNLILSPGIGPSGWHDALIILISKFS